MNQPKPPRPKTNKTGFHIIYRIYSPGFIGCYIGSTSCKLEQRFKQHLFDLSRGKHSCIRFQQFYDNVSKDLHIEILAEPAGRDLNRIEREFIEADLTSFNKKICEMKKNKYTDNQLIKK